MEMFDLKPHAPSEIRGPFSPISTSVAGIQVGECLPELAKRMDKVALVRSMTSPLGEHNFGTHYMLTGYKTDAGFTVSVVPCRGGRISARAWGSYPKTSRYRTTELAVPISAAADSCPRRYIRFRVVRDPATPDFQVRDLDFFQGLDVTRLSRRRDFVRALNRFSDSIQSSSDAPADPELEQAYRLITSQDAKNAFNLDNEPRDVRHRYGPKTVGQSCVLARRLVEHGVPFVTVNHRGWDTHANMYTRLKEGYTGARKPVGLIPSLDLAFSALIDDLDERGRLDETLVVVMGEFGRTPKLNSAGGRDHWPRVFSVALAGGGIRGGQLIGESDAVGEGPKERPVTPADLTCTIFTLLRNRPWDRVADGGWTPSADRPPRWQTDRGDHELGGRFIFAHNGWPILPRVAAVLLMWQS